MANLSDKATTVGVPDASPTQDGLVTTGTQSFAGAKTFQNTIASQIGNAVNANLGADATGTTLTDTTLKTGRMATPHYTNAEEPMAIAFTRADTAANELYIGGGTSTMNAATLIDFRTAANNTTVTGTTRLTIDSAGDFNFQSGNLTTTGEVGFGAAADSAIGLKVQPAAAVANQTILGVFDNGGNQLFRVRDSGGNDGFVDIYENGTTNNIRLDAAGNSWFNGGNLQVRTNNSDQIFSINSDGALSGRRIRMAALDNGTVRAELGANHNATHGAAGFFTLKSADGTPYYFWVTNSGQLRFSTVTGNIGAQSSGTPV